MKKTVAKLKSKNLKNKELNNLSNLNKDNNIELNKSSLTSTIAVKSPNFSPNP